MSELVGGFGDIDLIKPFEGFNLNGLKKKSFPIRPMFLDVADPPCQLHEIADQDKCLCDRFKLIGDPVPPKGDLDSEIVFISREPSVDEVEEGEVFTSDSESGEVFVQYLEILKLTADQVYITSLLFCRNLGDQLQSQDVWNCARFHKDEFKSLSKVKYIFALGSHAFTLITGMFTESTPYIGKYFEVELNGNKVVVIPLHHPLQFSRGLKTQESDTKVLESLVS